MKTLIVTLFLIFPQLILAKSAEVELGRYLFNDVRLSLLGNRSCAICHSPDFGWANRFSRTPDVYGMLTALNTPSLLNVADYQYFSQNSSDAKTLEDAIANTLFSHNPAEMAMTPNILIERLVQAGYIYRPLFLSAYQASRPTTQHVISALSAYVKTIRSVDTSFHRFLKGDEGALDREQRNGWILFSSKKLSCTQCHGGDLLNKPSPNVKSLYINTGLYGVTNNSLDLRQKRYSQEVLNGGEFRIPSLVNVTETAPWGHDGSFWSLESVLDSYARGGREIHYGINEGDGALHPNKHPLIKGFPLSIKDKRALLAFFESLKTPKPSVYTDVTSPFCPLIKVKSEMSNCIKPFQYVPES